jgi:hypothetical protein
VEIATPLDDARLHLGDCGINARSQIFGTLRGQAGAQ